MQKKIILIGAMGVGKSTVSALLAEKLGLGRIDIDELRWAYFSEMPGYDGAYVDGLFEAGEEQKAFAYMKPFEANLVEVVLSRFEAGVFDFGAGYTVYEDESLFARVEKALAVCENVVLLRYSADNAESLEALRDRHKDIPPALYYSLNKPFIESDCNERLARLAVFTKEKSAEEISEEILVGLVCSY